MTLIDRYISKSVLKAIVLTVLLLSVFQAFVLFVNELGDIGKGKYTVFHALYYVLLKLPYEMYLFFPEACLLGALMGLGMLAKSNELLIVRAQGISILNVTRIILNVALVVVLTVCLLGEFILPTISGLAEETKMEYRSGGQTLKTAEGVWFRMKNEFIYIKEAESMHELKDILVYKFDDHHTLKQVKQIKSASFKKRSWILEGIKSSDFDKGKITTKTQKKVIGQFELTPTQVSVSNKLPSEMQLTDLWRYIKIKKHARSRVSLYEINFWRRVFQPLITCVMMFLAIPFVFGSLRESSMGKRVVIGAMVGFCFFTLNELAVPVGQIFHLPPLAVAGTPSVLFSLLGFYLITRMRR